MAVPSVFEINAEICTEAHFFPSSIKLQVFINRDTVLLYYSSSITPANLQAYNNGIIISVTAFPTLQSN